MPKISTMAGVAVGGVLAPAALATSYLTALTTLALWPRRQKLLSRTTGELPYFAILIPAHNEERLLARTLFSLQALDYPADRYSINVVADNCTDTTADIARQAGVSAFERFDDEQRGKGFALQWLLERVPTPDAYVFVDADSTLSANFLHVAAAYLAQGAQVVQAYYGGANPRASWRSALRFGALAAINYARPMGRQKLGLSAGLKGNGMVFRADVLQELGWQAYTRAEDAEMHTRLLLAGYSVEFAPEAQVWGEMATSREQANTQEARWEAGRLEIARKFVPQLLRTARTKTLRRQLVLADSAVELIIPPISTLAGAGLGGMAAGLVLRQRWLAGLGGLIVGQLAAYVLASLVAARAPLSVYKALLYAPFFVAWKLALYGRVLVTGQRNREWVRTGR